MKNRVKLLLLAVCVSCVFVSCKDKGEDIIDGEWFGRYEVFLFASDPQGVNLLKGFTNEDIDTKAELDITLYKVDQTLAVNNRIEEVGDMFGYGAGTPHNPKGSLLHMRSRSSDIYNDRLDSEEHLTFVITTLALYYTPREIHYKIKFPALFGDSEEHDLILYYQYANDKQLSQSLEKVTIDGTVVDSENVMMIDRPDSKVRSGVIEYVK